MSLKCRDIAAFLEEYAPTRLAEEWDNVGLMVGNLDYAVQKVMLCLDVTDVVVEEAIAKKVNMIISHHPFIFKGIKNINTEDGIGKSVQALIKNDICVYSAHTNLDVTDGGINDSLADLFGLTEVQNLSDYKSEKTFKLVVYIPEKYAEEVRTAICNAGAGWIGNYSDCTFSTKGIGTFKPLEGSEPFIGTKDIVGRVDECRLETIVPERLLRKVIEAMIAAHPYEEVAYDIYQLDLKEKIYGLGKIGVYDSPKSFEEFSKLVKEKLNINTLRIIGEAKYEIRKVAVFCGSFDGNYSSVTNSNADILVTGDIKHHTALDLAGLGLCVIDAGHYATERIILPVLSEKIAERFAGLEIVCSEAETDPIKYY